MTTVEDVVRNVEIINPQGKLVKVIAHSIHKLGTMAPTQLVLEYNGRKITPFEQRVRGWKWTLNTFAKLGYCKTPIIELIHRTNPFLEKIRAAQ